MGETGDEGARDQKRRRTRQGALFESLFTYSGAAGSLPSSFRVHAVVRKTLSKEVVPSLLEGERVQYLWGEQASKPMATRVLATRYQPDNTGLYWAEQEA